MNLSLTCPTCKRAVSLEMPENGEHSWTNCSHCNSEAWLRNNGFENDVEMGEDLGVELTDEVEFKGVLSFKLNIEIIWDAGEDSPRDKALELVPVFNELFGEFDGDAIARCEAWNNWTDSLYKDGFLTDYQYNEMSSIDDL